MTLDRNFLVQRFLDFVTTNHTNQIMHVHFLYREWTELEVLKSEKRKNSCIFNGYIDRTYLVGNRLLNFANR